MRLTSYLPAIAALLSAALICVVVAIVAANGIERGTHSAVDSVLQSDGQDWADIRVDGLKVTLSGVAPDEATRFRALKLAGTVVDSARVLDAMQVDAGEIEVAPKFAIEILRNEQGISLIGLVPDALDRGDVVTSIRVLAAGAEVTDLLQEASYPVPDGWTPALDFALEALAELPSSKISVAPNRVVIKAVTNSGDEKKRLEDRLTRDAPRNIQLVLTLTAPRPVITPFLLRFTLDAEGGRFDACSADTETARAEILASAAEAGLQGAVYCSLGLGVPSPEWSAAVGHGLAALSELGGGSITFSDADVALVALDTADQGEFDDVVADLQSNLPEVFSLTAVKPVLAVVDNTNEGPPEITATLSPEGLLQLRGRVLDERQRDAVNGFAMARFAGADVEQSLRLDDDLPDGWAARIFAGIEALSLLKNGALLVQPDLIDIRGTTGNAEANSAISRILSSQLGEAGKYAIAVTYEEALDPDAALPTPQECVALINGVLETRKVTFAPGSGEIEADALGTIDKIAEILGDCVDVKMEIAGHTDSQGRETMNQQLSQERASAVLTALQARRVLTANLYAKGYGEAVPIGDNETEEGREANRRIEFTLVQDPPAGDETAEDSETPEDGEASATGEEAEQSEATE